MNILHVIGHGVCALAGICVCEPEWIGTACDIPCIDGVNSGDGICRCYTECINGISCHLECSGHGQCDGNNRCQCDAMQGYKGTVCDLPGCPGWPQDCNGRGTCNLASKTCECDQRWLGLACEIPDCPGIPDCNGVQATCTAPPGENSPRCINCAHPYMGDGCELHCYHGNAVRSDSGNWLCTCDPCYSGAACDSFCSGHGLTCTNGTCDCGFGGNRGDLCEISGCPGFDVDCTGNGLCIAIAGSCICNDGWSGLGCQTAVCAQNCNNHGACIVTTGTPECSCESSYFGRACEYTCLHGTVANGTCICESCYNGFYCHEKCSGVGNCTADGICDCGFDGGRGTYCEMSGCPGLYNLDCSGHGSCILTMGECICSEGWTGRGCEQADCPANCNNRGVCDTSTRIPQCRNCVQGWMGPACEIPCSGIQQPMDGGICVCNDGCTHGLSCTETCGGHGVCEADSCNCADSQGLNPGWWGSFCTQQNCPGQESICSNHGSCIKVHDNNVNILKFLYSRKLKFFLSVT